MIIASACLLGIHCNYQGKDCANIHLRQAFIEGNVIPVCPEQLGGLPTPRVPAEIVGGSADDVLRGCAKVVQKTGCDVTGEFLRGAKETLLIVRSINPEMIILKERSPSCGVHEVYDGTHTGRLVSGSGITSALLQKEGFKVISSEDFLPV